MRIGVVVALALVAGCKGSSEGHDMHEGDAKTLPASCTAYQQLLERLPQCEAMSKQELASLLRVYHDMSAVWVNRDLARMPANTLRAIDNACTQGRDVVRERIAAQCPENAEPVERVGDASKLPTSCVVMSRNVDALMTCDKLPQASRDALKQGYDAMAQGWRNVDTMASEAVKALDEACRAASDAYRQAGDAARCAMPGMLPDECEDYRAAVYKLSQCDKIPQQSRDALRQGFETMASSWKDVDTMPREARAAMADACREGATALKQAASAACGW